MSTAFDLEHFNDLIDRVKARHWSDYRSDDVQTIQQRLVRLCHLVGEFLTDVANGDDVSGRAPVEHGIVYFVLNQTRWDGHRRFAAWVNSDLVEHIAPTPSPEPEPPVTAEDGSELASVVIGGQRGGSDVLRYWWRHRWDNYRRVTETLREQKLTTWNQFLLTNSAAPGNLGIAWGILPNTYAACSKSYSILPLDSLRGVKVPATGAGSPPSDAYRFDPSDCRGRMCPLRDLELRLEAYSPQDIRRDNGVGSLWHSQAECMIFHLLNSYSIGQTTAFVSLPIIHRSSHPGGVSVLSIGSTLPLAASDILLWTRLGATIFGPLHGDETFAQLCAETTFANLPPSRCYELTHSRMGGGDTLDQRLWGATGPVRTHHTDALFSNVGFLRELDEITVVVPRVGEISPCVILRNELALPQSASLDSLAKKATTSPSRVGEIRQRLQGNLNEHIYVLLAEANSQLQSFKRRQLIRAEAIRDTPSAFESTVENDSAITFVPLYNGGTSEDNVCHAPHAIPRNVSNCRFYVSPDDIATYFDAVFNGIERHLGKCLNAQGQLPLSVLVHVQTCPDRGQRVWLFVCNEIICPPETEPQSRGGTVDELKMAARRLEAECCFDGTWELNESPVFVTGPQIHFPPASGKPADIQAVFADAIAPFILYERNAARRRTVFVNGIAFRVFQQGDNP
jgi:hypothetical protein